MFSECTKRFLTSLRDPFSPDAVGACVPNGGPPTRKVTVRGAFTAASGTSAGGHRCWIGISPSVANDAVSFWHTNSDCPDATLTPATDVANPVPKTGWSQVNAPTPYPSSAFQTSFPPETVVNETPLGRIVSVGVRVEYIGTELNKGGMYTCFYNSEGTSLYGATATSMFTNADSSRMRVAEDKPCTLVLYPNTDSQMSLEWAERYTSYPGAANGNSILFPLGVGLGFSTFSTTLLVGAMSGAICIDCPVGGMNFNVEYVMHLEYAHGSAANMATPNPSDPVGMELVIASLLRTPTVKRANPKLNHSSAVNAALSIALKGVSSVFNATPLGALPQELTRGMTRPIKKKIKKAAESALNKKLANMGVGKRKKNKKDKGH